MNSPSAGSGGPPRGPQFDNRRIAAGLIDLVAVAAVGLAVSFVAGFVAGPDKEMPAAMGLLFLGWALFYYFACESAAGQTLGKRLMGVRVLAVDGSRADMGAIGARTVLRIIDGIGLYLVGLIVMIATGQRRQRLGDLAAKTIVTSADWTPATGRAATTAAAPGSSAIVLPTSAPELPADATASPFAPLATEPDTPPAVEAPSTVDASPAAPSVAEEPSLEPEEPSLATPDAPSVTEEPSLEPEAPSVGTPEPPVIANGSVEVASTPPMWSPEPAASASTDPIVDGPADGTWEPVAETPSEPVAAEERGSPNGAPASESQAADEAEADEPDRDEPVKLRSVETLSAMELLMSELEEDEPAGHRPAS